MSDDVQRVEPKDPISIVCYLQPQEAQRPLGVNDVWRVIRSYKWLILVTVLLGMSVGGLISLVMTPVYRSETTLALAHTSGKKGELSALAGHLGGLASLAGIHLPSGQDDVAKTMALFKSRFFTDNFIKSNNLLPVLYAKLWDPSTRAWRVKPGSSRMPTLLKAYKLFNKHIRSVSLDKRTGLVSLDIEWRNPRLAAQWANDLVARFNRFEQKQAIARADKSIAFLKAQLPKTNIMAIHQFIYELLGQQMRSVMWATVHKEYAFQVLDPAVIPERPIRPRPLIIVPLGAVIGLLLGLLIAIYRSRIKSTPNPCKKSA